MLHSAFDAKVNDKMEDVDTWARGKEGRDRFDTWLRTAHLVHPTLAGLLGTDNKSFTPSLRHCVASTA